MKTFIVFIAGFALAVLGLMSFESYQAAQRETQICHDCETDNFKEIPLADFFKDMARYKGTHSKVVRPGLRSATGDKTKEPSRVCVYTLDTLKKFICFIETYAKASGISTEGLGINFYYAVYPKKKSIDGRNFGSLHTLYLTPTYYDTQINMYMPFDVKAAALRKASNPQDSIVVRDYSLDSLWANSSSHTAFMMASTSFSTLTTSSDGDLQINQGQLCPPACNGIRLYEESIDY